MERKYTLAEHLNELRSRIIVCLVSFGIGVVCSFPFASYGLKILKLPASGIIERLVFFGPQEGFLVHMRIASLCGLIVSLPVILYQLWMFIQPALGERQRKHSGIFIFFCSIFFMAGCLFAYFILIPPALRFLLTFGAEELEPVISAQKYISFVISLIMGSGLVFQMPILSLVLSRWGVINARTLRKKYKYAVVVIFIISAAITPTPDAFNMSLLALPMLFLYELSIWISFFARPKPKFIE